MDTKENALLSSQAAHYVNSIAQVFYAVLQKGSPLDNELKQYFRKHGECGSKDRYCIRESCFALFRWYGWLRLSLPGGLPENPIDSKKFCHSLLAALWLEQHDKLPFFLQLLIITKLDSKKIESAADDLEGKINGLARYFKIKRLNISQLVPEWFDQTLPADTKIEPLIEYLQKRPPVWIRTKINVQNKVKEELIQKNIEFEQEKNSLTSFKIKTPMFKANTIESYNKGDFEIQDLASQCIGLTCNASSGETWWDVCAGSGGKSLMLADQMQDEGRVVATDIRDEVLVQLNKRAKRAKCSNIIVEDLGAVCSSEQLYDGVLVDAPCSCMGIWRRSPNLKWTVNFDEIKTYVQSQLEICEMAANKVKVNGVLVYATCSLSVQENEEVIEEFLKNHNNFKLDQFVNPLNKETNSGMARVAFYPRDNDGVFIARLKRVD